MWRGPRRRHPWQHLWKARNDACFCPFCLNLTSFLTFLDIAGFTQNTYIVVKYKIHLYSLWNRPEKLAKGSLFCLFLKLVQINFIFTDNVRILYIYVCVFIDHYRVLYVCVFMREDCSIWRRSRWNPGDRWDQGRES
jgi:hypothetical protein